MVITTDQSVSGLTRSNTVSLSGVVTQYDFCGHEAGITFLHVWDGSGYVDFAAFTAWCAGRALDPIPAVPETVAAFIADQANAGFRAL